MAFASGVGKVRHLIMIRNDELIYWDNLTPQQAYVKQSEVLLSSATLVKPDLLASHTLPSVSSALYSVDGT